MHSLDPGCAVSLLLLKANNAVKMRPLGNVKGHNDGMSSDSLASGTADCFSRPRAHLMYQLLAQLLSRLGNSVRWACLGVRPRYLLARVIEQPAVTKYTTVPLNVG
jgi:hypothetical protein